MPYLQAALSYFLILFTMGFLSAQESDSDSLAGIPDSAKAVQDSKNAEEYRLLQLQEQARIDSVIMLKLEEQLSMVSNDAQKRAELEERLRQIEVSDSINAVELAGRLEGMRETSVGAPVVLKRDTLFYIYTRAGSFTPEVRASAIGRQLEELYEDPEFNPDSLISEANFYGADLRYGYNQLVMGVTNEDGLWHGKAPIDLANEHRLQFIETIEIVRQRNSISNIGKRVGQVLLIILGLWLVIRSINMGYRRVRDWLYKNRQTYLQGIKFRDFQLLSPVQHLFIARRILNFARIGVVILAIYIALPLLFSVFPQTKVITNTLLGWVLEPAKSILKSIAAFLPNLFTIAVIYFFTHYVVKGIRFLTIEVGRGNIKLEGFHADWAKPTFNIVRFLLYVFMFIVIFPYLPGSDSPAFQGVSVFLGILISLGSGNAISNVMAGLVITYMRPFKTGDRVKIGDVVGDVVEKNLLICRLKTIKNEDITVPNSMVLSGYTTNFTTNCEGDGLIMYSTVTIGYDVPWPKMHEVLKEAAGRTEGIQKNPEPFVLQTSLDDFYVSYQINA